MIMVSVIVALRDVKKWKECIHYVMEQSYAPMELVLVTDQKGKKSISKKVKGIENCFEKIQILEMKRGFVPGAEHDVDNMLIYGAGHATGEYLIFSDEMFCRSEGWIKKGISSLEEAQASVAVSDIAIHWNNGSVARYNYAPREDEPAVPFEQFIDYGIGLYGSTFLHNKIISSRVWKEMETICAEIIEKSGLTLYPAELALTATLNFVLKKREDIVYPDAFILFKWKAEDDYILSWASKKSSARLAAELETAQKFITDLFESNEDIQADMPRFANTSAIIMNWRMGWAFEGLKAQILQIMHTKRLDEYVIERAFRNRFEPVAKSVLTELQKHAEYNKDISIYVSCEKPVFVPESEYLIPIQVGTDCDLLEQMDVPFSREILSDNAAEDNLSKSFRRYRSLTAQYYAWRNAEKDGYYGFFQDNHYLDYLREDAEGEIPVIDEELLRYSCSLASMVVPHTKKMLIEGRSAGVYEYFMHNYCKEDLEAALRYISQNVPEINKYILDILFDDEVIPYPVFIADRKYFNQYCEILFPMLAYVDEQVKSKDFAVEKYASFEFLSSILLNAFVNYTEEKNEGFIASYKDTVSMDPLPPLATVEKPESIGDKELVTVCLACNDGYVQYAAVLIQSIIENANSEAYYDIVLLHRDIQEINQKILLKMFKRIENASLRFCNVSANFAHYAKKLFVNRHLSLETYYRFMILDIFKDYEKVLYLDCDMVVDDDVAKLFREDLTGCYAGAVRDLDFISAAHQDVLERLHEDSMNVLDFDDWYEYFNAGLMLFNLQELRKDLTTEMFFQAALSRSWSYHDQDTLNMLFHGKMHYFDQKWNMFWYVAEKGVRTLLHGYEPESVNRIAGKALQDLSLIHYTGAVKPWHKESFKLENPTLSTWWKYARISPYYEKLIFNVMETDSLPRTWSVCTCEPNVSKGWPVLSVEITPDDWCSNYVLVDVIYLADDGSSITDTLYIVMNKYHEGIKADSIKIDVTKFIFKENNAICNENIGFVMEGTRLDVWCRSFIQYRGFSFAVREIASRSHMKPVVKCLNEGYIGRNELVELPSNIRFVKEL